MDVEESSIKKSTEKVHPWRRCGKGEHLVCEHIVHVPPSKKHLDGNKAICHEHCAKNPSQKDELSFSEIQYISTNYFANLKGLPTANVLTNEYPSADNYDVEIRGWTQYWNDIFKLPDPLDPDFVKALIGTESSFDLKPKGNSKAFGLMQLLPETFSILRNINGELKDYLICLSKDHYLDASANICSGIRWIFQKKKLAGAKLKRESTWEEAIIEYKGYWHAIETGIDPEPMRKLRRFYRALKGKA
ncbi:MAG TPA: transglycosylase SLT domain-containing protein [Gammaproteobacteria bacterium]|jgi:hypothetical protein|nr:transglycosylase SLT domain-containing protein [Gammaproteobacteria bacterium]